MPKKIPVIRLNPAALTRSIITWFAQHARDLPWRRTSDPYPIWISEIMLQQTQVKTVIGYWQRWMTRFPTIESVARASEQAILKSWEGLGYYSRARNIQKAARLILEKHHGLFPAQFDAVLALPGIGRYTAGAICSIAYNQPTAILDGNVARVLSRVYCLAGDTKSPAVTAELWRRSEQLVKHASAIPANGLLPCSALNQGLMELGALICTPRNPLCFRCPIQHGCGAHLSGQVAHYPTPVPKSKPRQRLFFAFILKRGRSVLLRKKPSGEVNAGLWEFPSLEIQKRPSRREQIRAYLGMTAPPQLELVKTVRHTITTNRITLRVYQPKPNCPLATVSVPQLRWVPLSRLPELPFSSAHGKIRAMLLQPGAGG